MTQATLADKVMKAAYFLDTGCPIKDVLTDEEIDLAISMLADVPVSYTHLTLPTKRIV